MKGVSTMLKTNQVRSGNTVRVIPYGILAKVTYNEKGVISGVYISESGSNSYNELSQSVIVSLQKNETLPSRISPARKSTVYGVFYIPGISVQDIVSSKYSLQHDTNKFNFIAYNVVSSDSSYVAYNQQVTLQMMGFKVCNSFIVSPEISSYHNFLKVPVVMSMYPFISGYAVVESDGYVEYVPETVMFHKVADVTRTTNQNGYIDALINMVDKYTVQSSYTQVVRFNVQKNSYVAVDDGSIVHCSDYSNLSKKVDNDIRCTFCGKLVHVPDSGFVKCSNDNCTSNLYPVVQNMIHVLGLPSMTYDLYISYVRSGEFTCVSDLFVCEPYRDIRVDCTVSDVLKALCPIWCVHDRNFFDKFAQSAGSLSAIFHYLENPEEISKDMGSFVGYRSCEAFKEWISIAENLLMVKTMYDIDNVNVITDSIVLDVPKLFRNKNIYLEGEFNHGCYEEVSSILKSYGADIVSVVDTRCDCVIIGNFVRDVKNNATVNIAISYNIPVYNELQFFSEYGIDDDIKQAI